MIVKLLTEHHLEFLSLKGGCRGSSESTHVKMSHCWKSHALEHISINQREITKTNKYSMQKCILKLGPIVTSRICSFRVYNSRESSS